MFNIFRLFGNPSPTPTLDSVRFDTTGYEAGGEPHGGANSHRYARQQARVWFTPDGDGVGLYFFALPPDLPNVASIEELLAFHSAGLASSGGQVVELSSLLLDGCPAVRLIVKIPQQPTGMTYVGSLTIPFRDFSFVVKVQCVKRGCTGMRESVLLARRLRAGEMPLLNAGRMQLANWNPDDESFDAEFPDHPVSRARMVLARLASSILVDKGVKGLPGFPLPESAGP